MTEERRLVTVLFADVTGSTALGESLDPEALRGLLSRYFLIAREIVDEHGGTVEKFIGDAVMAVFGLPTAHDDDTVRALSAALALRDRIRDDPDLGARLPIRLGVNSGEVVASRDIDAGDFLVTGDVVNVAARLQQNGESWTILVGERAVHAARGTFTFRRPTTIAAKGKELPIPARELLGRAALRVVERTPLVGRASDLTQLELAAHRSFDERRPYLVSVIAAPGVGKSRLLEEFIDRLVAANPDVTVAVAQCLPYGQRLTYWPLRALLFDVLGLSGDAPPEALRSEVKAWLQEAGDPTPERTADLLAATIGAAETDVVDRAALFAAWRSTIELAAARGPLLVAVEDLHWSSDSLLDLVEFILQPRGDVPLVMVALARPELLDRRPGWGGGRRNFVSLALEPLEPDEIAELVADLLDTPDRGVVESVVARAEGNPFYAGEIVRSVVERVPDLRDVKAVEACLADLPDTVQATILARLDALPGPARRMLQLGSVFGRSFGAPGLAALGLATDQARDATDALLDRDLVRSAGRDTYAFRHILIREVAYGTLTRAERIRLHDQAGGWLEATAGQDAEGLAELIAFHYREAIALARTIGQAVDDDTRRRAVDWLGRAAAVAVAAAANREAARHLRSAIELADRDELPELYLRLGQTMLGGDEGIAAFAQAYEIGREHGRSDAFLLEALALRLTAMTRWFASVANQPSIEAFDELIAEARALFERVTDDRTRALFLVSQAFVPFWLRNLGRPVSDDVLARSELSAQQGLEIAERLDDSTLVSAALDGLGGVVLSKGDPAAAVQLAGRRLSLADRLVLQERLDAYNVFAWQSSLVGDLDGAVRAAQRGLADVQPGQDEYFALAVANWLPYCLAILGRWDDVPGAAERCRQLWIDGGRSSAGYALSGFIAALGVAQARGDDAGTERWAEVIEGIANQFDPNHPSRRLRAFIGPDLAALGRDIAGRAEFYLERLQHVERAFALLADHRHPLAADIVERIVGTASARGTKPLLGQAFRVRGLQAGDPEDLARAMALFIEVGAIPSIARVEVELGELTGDATMVERGIGRLESLGDIGQLGRVRSRSVEAAAGASHSPDAGADVRRRA